MRMRVIRRPVRPKRAKAPAELPAPRGLAASTFAVGHDEYVIFEFPLPELRIPEGLTQAERDVVRGAVQGQSNAEIARARRASPNTVANQLRSAYAKLGISGRLELARRCRAAGVGSS